MCENMKYKKIFLIAMLLLMFATITSISANDNATELSAADFEDELQTNEFNELESAESNVASLEETNDDKLNQFSENDLLELNDENMISSENKDVLGDDEDSYKITIKPVKVYSHNEFTYTATLTNNGKPVSGVRLELYVVGIDDYGAKTNSKGIATFNVDPLTAGKHKVRVGLDDEIMDELDYLPSASSYITVIKNPKSVTKVKAPKITAKYKTKKYFKITLKNYKGKPIKKFILTLEINTGKKWKTYYVKTNSKGVAKFNVKKLKPGKHIVTIYDDDADSEYDIDKSSKIIIKKTKTSKKTTTKKTTPKKKSSKYKTFKSPSGYKWKIKKSTWKKMKKQAKKHYKFFKSVGSGRPGYSDKSVKVKVTRNGHKYSGIALAVKNSRYYRCEVRGAVHGLYISNKGDQIV